MNLICPQKVLDQNFTLWTSVSFSLMVIGWEDCRMIGAISASSSGWEKVWVSSGKGFFSSLFSLFSCVCFIYLSSQRVLKVTPHVWRKKAQERVTVNLQFSYSQHSSILGQISLRNEKHQSSSQKVQLQPWSDCATV